MSRPRFGTTSNSTSGNCATIASRQRLGSPLHEGHHEVKGRRDQRDPFGDRRPELGVVDVHDHQHTAGAARAHGAEVRLREERLAGEPLPGPGQQGVTGGLIVGDVEGVGAFLWLERSPGLDGAALRRLSPMR